MHPVFLGPTASVGGFFLGPLYYYFMIPFLLLFRFDPVGPAVMVGLFGVATVGLVYLVGKRFFGIAAGLAASSLYALSPIVIAYSRSSWNPNLVPFFSLFLIYALHEAILTKKTYLYMLVGICYGAGLQFHYLFTFLLPVGAVYFLINRKTISNKLRSAIFVSFGFLSVTFPFIGFEIKNHFPNTRSIWQFVTAGKEVAAYDTSVVSSVPDIAFRLFSRLVYYFPPSEQWYLFNQTQNLVEFFFNYAQI